MKLIFFNGVGISSDEYAEIIRRYGRIYVYDVGHIVCSDSLVFIRKSAYNEHLSWMGNDIEIYAKTPNGRMPIGVVERYHLNGALLAKWFDSKKRIRRNLNSNGTVRISKKIKRFERFRRD